MASKILHIDVEQVADGFVFNGLEEGILEVSKSMLPFVLMKFSDGSLYPYDYQIVGCKHEEQLYYLEVYEGNS